MPLTIFISGMMCVRCKMAVKTVLDKLQLSYISLELGKVELVSNPSLSELAALDTELKLYELELVIDRNRILVDRIKIAITTLFENYQTMLPVRFSTYLSKTLFYNYTHLANVFSELEHSTIERYYIETRMRKAKDLLLSKDNSVNLVASELGFNSAAHFCLQFKKMTGKTPKNFRKQIIQAGIASHSGCEN